MVDSLQTVIQMAPYYVLPFLVALTIIVFVHEFGHYYIARLCGVKIEAFSVGFGKEIFGWHDKHGTRWKICWLPLGGYVRFEGDANAASMPSSDAPRSSTSFHAKPLWQRAAVVAAGPIANFILAIFIFAGTYMSLGERVIDPVAGEIQPGSVAEAAGIKQGDRILKLDGSPIDSFNDLYQYVYFRAGEEIVMTLKRGDSIFDIKATPRTETETDKFGRKSRFGRLGIKPSDDPNATHIVKHGLVSATAKGIDQTWLVITTTLKYVGKLFTGKESTDQLSGPMGIAQNAGISALSGLLPFLGFIGLISVSIGLINLFPVPMLDGGHLVYYAIEALRGRPLGPHAQEWGFRIGVSMVMMLLVVATWNDVLRIFGG